MPLAAAAYAKTDVFLRLVAAKRVLQNVMPDWMAFMWGLYVDVDALTSKPADPLSAMYREIAIAQFRRVYAEWSFNQLFLFLVCSALTCTLLYRHPRMQPKSVQLLLFGGIYAVAVTLDGVAYLCAVRFALGQQVQEQTHMLAFVGCVALYAVVVWRNNTFSDAAMRELISGLPGLHEQTADTRDRVRFLEEELQVMKEAWLLREREAARDSEETTTANATAKKRGDDDVQRKERYARNRR